MKVAQLFGTKHALLNLETEDLQYQKIVEMKYKTLIIERGVLGGRFKKPVKIRVLAKQN